MYSRDGLSRQPWRARFRSPREQRPRVVAADARLGHLAVVSGDGFPRRADENSTLGQDGVSDGRFESSLVHLVERALFEHPAHAAVGARFLHLRVRQQARDAFERQRFGRIDDHARAQHRHRPADELAIRRARREERLLVAHRDFFLDHRADLDRGQRAFEHVVVVVDLVGRGVARAGVRAAASGRSGVRGRRA